MAGKLSLVATPIGNLGDITSRALETLRDADYVVAEDTRHTKKLLSHFDIHTPLKSFHAHSTTKTYEALFDLLEQGKHLALVTDAGTPGVSDPGTYLIEQVRKNFGDTIEIIPIPGASALTSALSITSLPVAQFTFLGFPPQKKGRETFFKSLAEISHAIVLYESPHRFMKTLAHLSKTCPRRTVSVSRELTKQFESYYEDTPENLHTYFGAHPEEVRGEYTLIIGPNNAL